jgi:predicted O-methyltransferase YrrM
MSIATNDNRLAVVALANDLGARTIAEVGVRRGRLSVLLAKNVPTLERLYLIDVWVPEEETTRDRQDKNARSVKRWARNYSMKHDCKVTVLHMLSADAAKKFSYGELDFVYIDGDHSFKGVTADIESYYPKVSKHGVLSGDDYDLLEVRTAVDRLLPHRQVHANGRFWWAHK